MFDLASFSCYGKISFSLREDVMSDIVLIKNDLFAPPPKKPRKKPVSRRSLQMCHIPHKSNWKEQHGSWAVMKGIIKIKE
jgi:hypothetical protein